MESSTDPNLLEARGPRAIARYGFLAFIGLAVAELAAHAVTRARVPEEHEWAEAAAYVRERLEARDQIVVAPSWADPLLRHAFGDAITFARAGASDLAGFERLWTLSIRGRLPEGAPRRPPDHDRVLGRIRVLRWDLGPSSVRYDFVDHVRDAEVSIDARGRTSPCRFGPAAPRGGGLGAGTYWPRERFVCDPRRAFLWVGETVTEDLHLAPRRCIFQHPQGEEPVRATFRDVPNDARLVLYAGLYYEDERNLRGGPFTVRVLRDGAEVGRLVHRDGDGWKRLEMHLPEASQPTATFTIETTSPAPHRRSVCWAATIRGEPRAEAE